MTKRSKSSKLRARDVIVPIGLLILLIVVIVGTVNVGVQQGWQLPWGIGSVGLSNNGQTGSGQTGAYTYTLTGTNGVISVYTGTTTGTGQTGTGQSFIPVGQVAFNMKLIAEFTDGTNSTISSTGNLPGLDVIQIGGRSVKDVRAQTLIGFVSATPLPSTAIADIKANVTLYNEKTTLAVWRTYEYTSGFVDGGTTTLVLLPDFTVTAETVFSDTCSTMTNGTVTCSKINGAAPTPRRVDWSVQSTIVISGFSVIPQTFSGSTVSSADFSTTIQGCTNCGGNGSPSSPTMPATFSPNKAEITKPTPGPVGPTGGTDTVTMDTTPDVTYSGCLEILPSFCVVGSTGHGTKGSTDSIRGSDGSTSSAKGTQTGAGANKGSPNARQIAISLLPDYYVPLDLGNGSWEFLNPWAALFFAVIYIAFALGVMLLIILYRRLGRK